MHTYTNTHTDVHMYIPRHTNIELIDDSMGWLRLVGSLKLQVSFAKETYERDYFLQKGLIILRSLLTVATPYDSFILKEFRSLNFSFQSKLSIVGLKAFLEK